MDCTVAVTGVTLNKASTTLTVGGSETLTATTAPAGATNKSVTWTSSDPSVATVAGGVVTAVAAGTATVTVTTTDGGFTDTCAVTVNAASTPPVPPSYDYTPAATTANAAVSGDENTVRVAASITASGDATLRTADLTSALTGNDTTGTVSIDLSAAARDVKSVTLPAAVVTEIADAVTNADNATESLTLALTDGSVTFDAAAVASIREQAGSRDLKLNLDDVQTSALNTAQRAAVSDLDVRGTLDVYMTSGGQRISDFGGGSAVVRIPFTAPAGRTAAQYGVWYVAESGTMTNQRARYDTADNCFVFTVTHFSNYVIAYNGDCPQDDACPIAAFADADPAAWYHDGVHWALENGVMSGWNNPAGSGRVFDPDGNTSRAMVAMMLWRLEGSPTVNYAMDYSDVGAEQWYTEAVRWATSAGVITGYDGKFAPNDAVTREQLATMLWRYAQYKSVDVGVGEDTNILSYDDAFDVNEYAIPAMQWACGAGVMSGYDSPAGSGKVLDPRGATSRAVVATMLMRYCKEAAK